MNARRWLSPGIGIKRWLLTIFGGLLVLAMGVAHVVRQMTRDLQPTGLSQFVIDFITLQFLPYPLRGLLAGLVGVTLVAVGAVRLIRVLTDPLRPIDADQPLVELIYQKRFLARGPRIVAIGGGTGLSTLLRGLKEVSSNLTAVVTVADDGGSSGRLRDEFSVLPPGDLRMALAALCDDTEWGHTWRDVLQHRFPGEGPLAGHALGNLLIVSLWDLLGDTVDDLVGRLLNSRGRVLPMASVPLEIEAEIVGHDSAYPDAITTVRGQHRVASSRGRVQGVRLLPPDPGCPDETLAAVREADWVFLGPGSWFTSIMPHVLVPSLRDAIVSTRARRVLNLNLEVHTGETKGYRAQDHIDSLVKHAPELRFDVVLADPSCVDDAEALRRAVDLVGAELVVATVSAIGKPGQHDPLRLAAAYRDVIS
jgi:uncharacterized cofD-like protein